jgi:hypothetical protein
MRSRLEYGDAALSLADAEIEKAKKNKKKPDVDGTKVAVYETNTDMATKEGLKWENASVLFGLMANDLERETK